MSRKDKDGRQCSGKIGMVSGWRDILTVMDYLFVSFGYKSKTRRCQQKV